MYEKLDDFLSGNFSEDSWYDDGCCIADDMIDSFVENDWIKLRNNLPSKEILWKRRLAYCLTNNENVHELEILLNFIDTQDEDLFELTINSLVEFNTKECKQFIMKKNPYIFENVKNKLPNKSIVTTKLLENFLTKMSCGNKTQSEIT